MGIEINCGGSVFDGKLKKETEAVFTGRLFVGEFDAEPCMVIRV